MTTADFMKAFESAAEQFNSGAIIMAPPPQFVLSSTKIDGVRSEYCLGDSHIKYHFWPDPAFPENFQERLASAFKPFPPNTVVIEYVPEVDSWYTHVQDLPLGASPELAEQLLKKASAAVRDGR